MNNIKPKPMKTITIKLILIALLSISLSTAQQTPAPKQSKVIAITGATAHIGNGTVIENSIVIFENGILKTVSDMTLTKINLSDIEVIQATGKHIYPGFIVPNSTLGLVEIGAVRATNDESELGSWNPHIRSIIAYNTESKIVESMRPNGVLLGQITPRGGRISGTSSIVQFDAWNWEDAIIKEDDGIHINWPNSFSRGRWWLGEGRAMMVNKNYEKQVTEMKDYFNNSKSYLAGTKTPVHLPYEAISGLFNDSKTLYIHVNDEKGITDAVNFTKTQRISKVVIVGGYEAFKVAEILKNANVSVLLKRVHSRPNLSDDDYDLPFKLATLLTNKGVTVALEPSGQMERMNSRNLPFYAGTTVAHGLSKEQALQLITLNTAKILGIDAAYGSLETGKSATLFISEGDALDMRTNIVTEAFIDGRRISLNTHQTELWQRYSKKFDTQN